MEAIDVTTRPTTTRRRPGLTLVEALVALFVAAIGMICLMTLFPLGALQMGQSLKDERCGQLAMQADTRMRWYWQTYVLEQVQQNKSPDSFIDAMDDPDINTSNSFNPAQPNEVSYPVFVDPIGWQPRSLTTRNWVGDGIN